MRRKLANLQPGQNYAIQVRAIDDGLTSEWSEKFIFTASQNTTAPVVPTSVSWVVSDDAFVASWAPVVTDVAGALAIITAYEMEFTATGTTKIVSVPQKTETNLVHTLSFDENVALFGTPKPSIDFRVRAVDNKGAKSAWSATINAANPAPAAPTAPASGSVAVAGIDSVRLAWTPPADKDLGGYNVYTGSTAGFTPAAGNKIYSGVGNSYVYNTTTYALQYFKIYSVDKFGQESTAPLTGNATPTSSFGADTTAPATPTGLTATMVTSADAKNTVANVSWAANTEPDLADYRLRYRKAGDTNWSNQTVGGDQTATTVIGLQPYANYEFQLQAVDFSANESAFTTTSTGTGATNNNPSQPQAPGVASNTLQIQVTPTGLRQFDGTAMEADVAYYEVYASTSAASFTPAAANQLGVIPVGPAMATTFQVPAGGNGTTQTWYVKVIAVDTGGLKGSASPAATANPNLIANTNIVDATITTAKIVSLNADKLTAGSGIINDIIVKSKLTLGDASTVGTIETYDYTNSGGSTGASFSKNGIIIKTGAIEAAALKIQNSQNMLKPEHADFEFNPASIASFIATSNGTAVIETTAANVKFNSQSLKWIGTGAGWIWLGLGNTDYTQIRVEASKTYIVSFYAMVPTGGTAQTVGPVLRYTIPGSTADSNGTNQSVPANSTWARYTTTVTTGATATGTASLWFNVGAGTMYLDGIQLEEKETSLNTPSSWKPPGITRIDGGLISTGAIRSTSNNTINGVSEPIWNIPLNGSATFQSLRVLGSTVLGNGAADNDSIIASSNYVAGQSGWRMNASGVVEFRQVAAQSFDGAAIRTDTLDVNVLKSNSSLTSTIKVKGALTAENEDVTSDGYGSTVTLSGAGFFVKGPTSKGNPDYIVFPTSGAPNIISGTLQAQTLTVNGLTDPLTGLTTGASFRGSSHFELNSELTFDNAIGTPLAAPSVTFNNPTFSFTGGTSGNTSLAYDSTASKFWRVENMVVIDSIVSKAHRFSSTGVWETSITVPRPAPPTGGTMTNSEIASITNVGSSWYVLWKFTGTGQAVLSKHDGTTWALQSKTDITAFGNGSASQLTLGKDATNLLLCSWNSYVTNGTTRQAVIRHIDPTTLTATGTDVTCDSYPSATTSAQTGGKVSAVLGGEFNYGSGNKTYIVVYETGTMPYVSSPLYTYNASGTYLAERKWTLQDSQSGGLVYTAAYNTSTGTFFHINHRDTLYRYGPETWTTESYRWGFAYSWYKLNGRTVSGTTSGTGGSIVAAAGTFKDTDQFADINGTGLAAGTTILSTSVDGTTATLSTNATPNTAVTPTIAYETTISPMYQFSAGKRMTYYLTGAEGPPGTVLRVYMGRGPDDNTYPSRTQVYLQGTLAGGVFTYSTEDVVFSGVNPKPTGTFAAGTPARMYSQKTDDLTVTGVTSTSGSPTLTNSTAGFFTFFKDAIVKGTNIPADTKVLSVTNSGTLVMTKNATATGNLTITITRPSIELRGDGYARISELYAQKTILTSDQDVTAGAGNTPPLRIGNINTVHMRIDGNEIQAMDTDSTVGALILQQGGGVLNTNGVTEYRMFGRTFRGIDWGERTDTTDANGDITVNHALGAVPAFAIVSGSSQAGVPNLYMPHTYTSTNFKVRCRTDAGTPLASGLSRTVAWFAVRA